MNHKNGDRVISKVEISDNAGTAPRPRLRAKRMMLLLPLA